MSSTISRVLKAYIGLVNPKSATNVGAVLRASGCYQVEQVFYTGQRYQYASRYHTDTQDSAQTIPLTALDSFEGFHREHVKKVCVELVEGATPLPHFEHPEQAMYIFGPEDGSIPQQIVDEADAVVYIPTTGCLNLAATVNVLLYDRMAKLMGQGSTVTTLQGDALIRSSRDQNNRLKVKPR